MKSSLFPRVHSKLMATLSVGLVIVFLGLPLLLLADTPTSGGGGGGGGCGAQDSDCDGRPAMTPDGYNDARFRDLDDNDPSIGSAADEHGFHLGGR